MCSIGNGFVLIKHWPVIYFFLGKRLLGDKNFMHHMESWRGVRSGGQIRFDDPLPTWAGLLLLGSGPDYLIFWCGSKWHKYPSQALIHPWEATSSCTKRQQNPCKDDWDYGGINIMLPHEKKPLNAAVFFCDSRFVFFDPDSLVAAGVYMSFTHLPKPLLAWSSISLDIPMEIKP